MPEPKNIAIVLSAGKGARMHAAVPKQYMDLCGMPVIAWALKAFEQFDPVDEVVLVAGREDIDYCRSEIIDKYRFKKVTAVIPGAEERYLSVWEGLQAARARVLSADAGSDGSDSNGGSSGSDGVDGSDSNAVSSGSAGSAVNAGCDGREACIRALEESIVFIHDGARPLIDRPVLKRVLFSAKEDGACAAGMPAKDTIKIADEKGYAQQTPDRSRVWQMQTPQVFSLQLVYEAYRTLIEEGIRDVTDDAMVVERMSDVRVKLVEGSYRNLKITTPEDLVLAQALLSSKMQPADA